VLLCERAARHFAKHVWLAWQIAVRFGIVILTTCFAKLVGCRISSTIRSSSIRRLAGALWIWTSSAPAVAAMQSACSWWQQRSTQPSRSRPS
jgi:hypothetical protein